MSFDIGLVTCGRIGQSLQSWLREASDEQKEKLCEALSCAAEQLAIEGTLSVDL